MATTVEYSGIKISGGRLFILISFLSTIGTGLWGFFTLVSDYKNMQELVTAYKPVDVSSLEKRISIIEKVYPEEINFIKEESNFLKDEVELLSSLNTELARDLKNDVRHNEKIVESVEDKTKIDLRAIEEKIDTLEEELDLKIQKALSNPLKLK